MRKLSGFFVFCLLLLAPLITNASTFLNNEVIITETTFVQENSPYHIEGQITIEDGAKLRIEEGVTVLLGEGATINAFGDVEIVGSKDNPAQLIPEVSSQNDEDNSPAQQVKWHGIYIYDSTFNAEHAIFKGMTNGLYFFESESSITNSIISDSDYGFSLDKGSVLELQDTKIDTITKTATQVFSDSVFKTNKVTITDSNEAVVLYSGKITLSNSTISGNQFGITAYSGRVEGEKLKIVNNNIGLYTFNNAESLFKNSAILQNTNDVINYGQEIDLRNIWWGRVENIETSIEGMALYTPWLTEDPFFEVKCCSSIAFIPGLQGSRLYLKGKKLENQLWEPNAIGDIRKLFLDDEGDSIEKNIYSRDLIDDIHGTKDIYGSFLEYLDELVEVENLISEWESFPYDWRFDLDEIVSGKFGESIDSITDRIEEMAKNSRNGKVTIVAHSYGGLVAKRFIKELQIMKNAGVTDLLDKIDRLILVAVPEYGTPQALASILNGFDQSIIINKVIGSDVNRDWAQNMQSAFNLLPTEKYFLATSTKIIDISDPTSKYNNWKTIYREIVSDFETMNNFLLGKDGRKRPDSKKTNIPNVVSESFIKKASVAHDYLNDFSKPETLEIYRVIGSGLPTVLGLQYSFKKCQDKILKKCKLPGDESIEFRPIIGSSGDGTVVLESAEGNLDSKNYYLDLNDLNKNKKKFESNITHGNIMISTSIQSLIGDILSDFPEGEKDYGDFKNNKINHNLSPITTISVHSPVSLTLYDAVGRKTGLNTVSKDVLPTITDEIPNSIYFESGEGKYISVIGEGDLKADIIGEGNGTFTLIKEYKAGNIYDSYAFEDIPVQIGMRAIMENDIDQVPILKIDQNVDGVFESEILPEQNISHLQLLNDLKYLLEEFNLSKSKTQKLISQIDRIIILYNKDKLNIVAKKIDKFAQKFIDTHNRHSSVHKHRFKHLKSNHIRHLTDVDKQKVLKLIEEFLNGL